MVIKLFFISIYASVILLTQAACAQVFGCTDPLASNYNAIATQNDGSCVYSAASISVSSSYTLSDSLQETSGLIKLGNFLYSQNDDTDKLIYKLDTLTGNKLQTFNLNTIHNKDWEEISQDNNYIYVGDFGNNDGSRTDLKIYKIDKASFFNNTPIIDSILFSYSNQVNFTPANNNTNYDCEAFIVTNDSIYLFTKQWVSNGCSVYSLPKNPGTYTANLQYGFNPNGLITGATYVENKQVIVLSGYNSLLQPFVFLLYDFQNGNFISGNKRRIDLTLPFHQIESIASYNGINYFLTNEKYINGPISNSQKLHTLNLNSYLGNYVNTVISEQSDSNVKTKIFPNPNMGRFNVEVNTQVDVIVRDLFGNTIFKSERNDLFFNIQLPAFCKGIYLVTILEENRRQTFKLLVE